MQENIIKHSFEVTRRDRQENMKHSNLVLWFTGLSGSGKSTIANALEKKLLSLGFHAYVLDGDNLRSGLNKDLTFSSKDRKENIRRVGEIANLMLDAGVIVLSAFISPYREDRENVKNIIGEKNFIEIYINTPLEECERRDVKGLYAKARLGEIKNFTGISAPYEAPINPMIQINTKDQTVAASVDYIFSQVSNKLTLTNE